MTFFCVLRLKTLLIVSTSVLGAAAVGWCDDWPTFRGAQRTSVSTDKNLLKVWPEGGPKLVWETTGAGRGYSSIAVVGDRLFTLGDGLSTADDKDEYLTCFDRKSGKQLWATKTGPAWTEMKPDWHSSRSTPTVDGAMVYVISPKGMLVACNVSDGKEVWRKDLADELGGKKADPWGYSESVLIDGDHLICTPGGEKATIVALDKKTGATVWTAASQGDIGAGHASIVISKVGTTTVYVQTTGSGAIGVAAKNGTVLWTYPITKTTAVIPTPIVRDDFVFFSVGYGQGGALLQQVADASGTVTIKEIFGINKKLGNKHGGIVLIGNYIYGDAEDRGTPFCADLMTGDIQWQGRGPGKGSAVVIGGDEMLYVQFQDGMMALVKADPKEYSVVSEFKIPGSGDRPSWAHPVIVDKKLFVRSQDKILCYDIAEI